MAIPDNSQLSVHNVEQNLTNPISKFVCASRPPFRTSIFPHLENCAGALRALPSDSEGVFHSGGAKDGFRLPLFERYKDCEVLVETARLTDDPVSSWVEIGLAAMELNMACLISYGAFIGGMTFCGGGDMVKISLRGTRGRPNDDNNTTTQATDTT